MNDLIPAERHELIVNLLRERGLVTVAELRGLLRVSEITVRRDLDLLERRGVLERTHGGAMSTRRVPTEPPYAQKNEARLAEKIAIGRAAAALVESGDTLLVNSGSTTLQVIRSLRASGLRVVTSNAGAVNQPGPSDVEIVLIGGVYRPQSNSLVGPLASLSLEQLYGSKAIIGVDGISSKYGLSTPVHLEAEIAKLMIARTRGPVIVVADHTKVGAVSNFVTSRIEEVDILVTDTGFEEEYRSELESAGVEIVIAAVDQEAGAGL